MVLNRTKTLRLLRLALLGLAIILIGGYAISRSLAYAQGPRIDIFEPLNGSSSATSTVLLRGRAQRVNTISLNGNPLSVDEQGDFSQTLIVFRGVNTLTIHAGDQFGRSIDSTLTLYGASDLPVSQAAASSSRTL